VSPTPVVPPRWLLLWSLVLPLSATATATATAQGVPGLPASAPLDRETAPGLAGLPAFAPLNPVADSRTALLAEPYRLPAPGRWSWGAALDYGSAVELFQGARSSQVLDAELLRFRVRVARDLSPSVFVLADAAVQGSYAGFLDGFLDWYHGLLGITIEARDHRPKDTFRYQVDLPDGSRHSRRPSDLFLGDSRLAGGVRLGHHVQMMATLTLPTATGPDGYGRGVIGAGVVTTVRAPLARPLLFEGTVGLGYTPTHGDLDAWQRTTFLSGSSGLRWRFWGRQSLYGNLFWHSPYYDGTGVPSLDRRDLALDFGWLLATRSGREWRVGMTEDPEPSGPGVDIIFRLGVTY
jgi:hypothetical protein